MHVIKYYIMYNRTLAIEYAQKWALRRNPNYENFDNMGGDCTNFISQCFFAGGIQFSYRDYGWFYHSLNSRSPSWTGVDEMFDFGINNKSNLGPKLIVTTINNINIGDIVQLNVNGKWSHSVIITKIISNNITDILTCAHDENSLNRALNTYKFDKIRFCKVN